MAGIGLLASGVVSGCSPLITFNLLVPKDGHSRRLATSIAYGEGPRRKLDIYAPEEGSTQAVNGRGAPVVVFFYGGSWQSGTRSGYGFVGRALAAKGFVTVVPDYRLVPQVTYPGFVEDGAAAVKWVHQHAREFGGDPQDIVLVGHSAGAYIAAMLAIDPQWLGATRGAVRGFVGIAGPYDFAPFSVPESKAAFGAWPHPAETQPVNLTGPDDPPSLLLYGERDELVAPSNSIALAGKLRAQHVRVALRPYAKLGHIGILAAIAQPFRGKAPVLADIAAFVRSVSP